MNQQDPDASANEEATKAPEAGQAGTHTGTSPGQAEPPATPKPSGRGIAWLALLLALIAAGVAGYNAWQQYQARGSRGDSGARLERLAGTLDQVQREAQSALGRADNAAGTAQATADELKRMQSQVAALESTLETLRRQQNAAGEQWQQLSQRLDRVTPAGSLRRLKLAEAELLIRSAYRGLALTQDPEPAVQALTLADALLGDINAPGLQPVRRALQQELQALKAVPDVDVPGLSARLHALIRRVPDLPLKNTLAETNFKAAAPEQSPDRGWWQATQDFLGRYFTVRRTDETGTELPAPETLHLLREQLQLKLEQARLALLQASPGLYHTSLQQAAAWIARYFDTGNVGVKATLNEINALQGVEIAPPLPDTGTTLRALEAARAELN